MRKIIAAQKMKWCISNPNATPPRSFKKTRVTGGFFFYLNLHLLYLQVVFEADSTKGQIMNGIVKAICIGPVAGGPMQKVSEAEALASQGLKGDRYATGSGSFNRSKQGHRQVTLMNAIFFTGSGFEFVESRRNLFTEGVELMWLIGREFEIGAARFRGVRYCDPCTRPSKLSGNPASFKEKFFDRGGLIAEILVSGIIRVGDPVIPPPKGY